MTTDELIAQFEACTLPASAFHHAQHVEAAWGYLRRYPLPDAIARFSTALQRYATSLGAAQKYDAALTRRCFSVIAGRLALDPEADWPAFAARHPDLLAGIR
jgi:hypothetical protein